LGRNLRRGKSLGGRWYDGAKERVFLVSGYFLGIFAILVNIIVIFVKTLLMIIVVHRFLHLDIQKISEVACRARDVVKTAVADLFCLR